MSKQKTTTTTVKVNKIHKVKEPLCQMAEVPSKSFKEIGRLKYCICGHLVVLHEMGYGCTAIIEGSECEDHWRCDCKCVICIHVNAYQKEQKEEKK